MIPGVTVIGLVENSGNESWLEVYDVYVFGFEFGSEEFEFSVGKTYSLPNGNHLRSLEYTVRRSPDPRGFLKWSLKTMQFFSLGTSFSEEKEKEMGYLTL